MAATSFFEGFKKYAEDTFDTVTKNGERVANAAKKVGSHFYEEIPKEERKTATEKAVPFRAKSSKAHDTYSKFKKKFNETVDEKVHPFSNKTAKGKFGNATIKGAIKMNTIPMNIIDKAFFTPTGRLISGLTATGFVIGGIEDSNRATVAKGSAENMDNMITETLSDAIENANSAKTVGTNQLGADADIVFALHNMRNGR